MPIGGRGIGSGLIFVFIFSSLTEPADDLSLLLLHRQIHKERSNAKQRMSAYRANKGEEGGRMEGESTRN